MPDFKVEIRAQLAELRLPPVREAEIVEELSQHLAEQYEEAMTRGASEEEARQRVFEELSAPDFLDWQRQNSVFTGMAAMVERSFNLTGVGEPERLDGRRVSANLFDVLAVPPLIGRTFVPDDDRPGTHVVLLSYRLWQRRFGSDPSIIGRAVTLNGENYTVIGVMQRGVHLPGYGNWNDELWVPINFTNEEITERGNHFL